MLRSEQGMYIVNTILHHLMRLTTLHKFRSGNLGLVLNFLVRQLLFTVHAKWLERSTNTRTIQWAITAPGISPVATLRLRTSVSCRRRTDGYLEEQNKNKRPIIASGHRSRATNVHLNTPPMYSPPSLVFSCFATSVGEPQLDAKNKTARKSHHLIAVVVQRYGAIQ